LTPKLQTSSFKKQKTIWLILILIIFASAGWFYYSRANTTRTSNRVDGQTALVQRGNLILSTTGSATLTAQTDATFGFSSSGQITQVYVKVGDQVEAGQVLAQLDDTLAKIKYTESQQALQELYSASSIAMVENEIATAKDNISSTRAWLGYLLSPQVLDAEENLATAEQELAQAQTDAKAVPSDQATQNVKTHEQIVAYLKDKLTQAQIYYQDFYLPENFTQYQRQGRKRVIVTYTDPVTGKELPQIDAPSIADIATARRNYIQAQQTVKDGETYLEILKSGTIPNDATGSKINTLKDAQLAVDNAQTALDEIKLIAPVSGTITALDVNVGEQGNTSTAVTISQLEQPYQLDAHIDGVDWSMAKVGNTVKVTFDLLPDKTFNGTVTLAYPVLDSSSESPLAHILVQLDNSISQNLPVGTAATIEVIGGEANNTLLVPASAVHKTSDGGGYAVTVIQNGQQTEEPVEIGLEGDAYIEIKSGLQPGTAVLTK